jgi:hypothetical protein
MDDWVRRLLPVRLRTDRFRGFEKFETQDRTGPIEGAFRVLVSRSDWGEARCLLLMMRIAMDGVAEARSVSPAIRTIVDSVSGAEPLARLLEAYRNLLDWCVSAAPGLTESDRVAVARLLTGEFDWWIRDAIREGHYALLDSIYWVLLRYYTVLGQSDIVGLKEMRGKAARELVWADSELARLLATAEGERCESLWWCVQRTQAAVIRWMKLARSEGDGPMVTDLAEIMGKLVVLAASHFASETAVEVN